MLLLWYPAGHASALTCALSSLLVEGQCAEALARMIDHRGRIVLVDLLETVSL